MHILINYEASWRNSFLDGDNNHPLPSGGRKFVGSMTRLKDAENYKPREVSLDTVMGVLNRLIGDQRKLYQGRQKFGCSSYFFEDIEPCVTFEDRALWTEEVVYLRNMEGSTDRASFTGMIKMNTPLLNSDYSAELWGVLQLDLPALCAFILDEAAVIPPKLLAAPLLNPLAISAALEDLGKPLDSAGVVSDAVLTLMDHFSEVNYFSSQGTVFKSALYCSALYLQIHRLSKRFDTSSALSRQGCLPGISKKGFTKKDFMKKFTTGDAKKIFGNPYIRTEMRKGDGKVRTVMRKAAGQLDIRIDVDRQTSEQIQTLIENAGVSSFYLGKKGLAYVATIDA